MIYFVAWIILGVCFKILYTSVLNKQLQQVGGIKGHMQAFLKAKGDPKAEDILRVEKFTKGCLRLLLIVSLVAWPIIAILYAATWILDEEDVLEIHHQLIEETKNE